MGENNKVLLGVLGGVLLGAFGAAVVKRGNLRPHAAKVLSYGYDIKDAIIEQAKTLKETCEDLAAEAKEKSLLSKIICSLTLASTFTVNPGPRKLKVINKPLLIK